MITHDGQGWPVFNGRRLPQILVNVGWNSVRNVTGIFIAGGLHMNVPQGIRHYDWEIGVTFEYRDRAFTIRWWRH